MKTLEAYQEGKVLLIDKPLNWTSFQVVNKIRWLIKQQFEIKKIKVGHAGTLDPLATGLLILCTGKFTKKIESYQAQVKEYTGTITLGATTPSYDLESEPNQTFNISGITKEDILQNTQHFIGEIQQQPPIFSALKKDGKRLYEYAREGEHVEIPKRTITINEFEITNIDSKKVYLFFSNGKLVDGFPVYGNSKIDLSNIDYILTPTGAYDPVIPALNKFNELLRDKFKDKVIDIIHVFEKHIFEKKLL